MIPYQTESRGALSEEREKLILQYMPQVHFIARRIYEKRPGDVSLDDLISSGTIGLIMAIDNYDASQTVKLNTYAEFKIRGAILDSLRSLDWASRHRRKKYKEMEAALARAQNRLGRPPTEEEIAAEMNITLEEYWERIVDVQGLALQSLQAAIDSDGQQTLLSIIPDNGELHSTTLERAELEKLVAEAVQQLPEIERLILALYYQSELTLREIGQIVKLSVSRVSELKTLAILRVRTCISARWPMTKGHG